MRFIFLLLIVLSVDVYSQSISSPDGKVNVSVNKDKEISISASYGGTAILGPSPVGLSIRQLKNDWTVRKTSTRKVDQKIYPPVREKRKEIRDNFNELTLDFKSKISLQIRAYDDGFAYRFMSAVNDSIIVEKEIATYAIPANTTFYGPPV